MGMNRGSVYPRGMRTSETPARPLWGQPLLWLPAAKVLLHLVTFAGYGYFRDEFYYRILDELKEAGKTVIAVTHDDRYWNLADRLVKFDLGKIAEVTP